jgi:amino acid transporter
MMIIIILLIITIITILLIITIYTHPRTHTPYTPTSTYIHNTYTHPPVSGCQVPQFGAALGWMAGGWFLGVGYLKYE